MIPHLEETAGKAGVNPGLILGAALQALAIAAFALLALIPGNFAVFSAVMAAAAPDEISRLLIPKVEVDASIMVKVRVSPASMPTWAEMVVVVPSMTELPSTVTSAIKFVISSR